MNTYQRIMDEATLNHLAEILDRQIVQQYESLEVLKEVRNSLKRLQDFMYLEKANEVLQGGNK